MSLRTRLVAGLLILVAGALAVSMVATWRILQDSLLDRVDERLVASYIPTREQLTRGDRRPPGGQGVSFGELRDSSGRVIASLQFSTDDTVPEIPASETASVETPRFETVDADGESFRVLIAPSGDGGSIVLGESLSDVDATLDRLLLIMLVVAAVTLGLLAAGTLLLVRSALRPLDRMEHEAGRIAAGDLSRRVEPADTRTEVGRLGLALNRMLTEIEAAFAARRESEERLRRFLADASHELRTPLASIRGYAELFRRGAAERPEDLALSMRRIEEESARMGVLVEDLLQLARLDESGAPELATAPMDLARVVGDACADARAVAPDREIRLDGPPTLQLTGDETRLRQVVSNLLMNAVTHTPAGTSVDVTLAERDGRAVLTVTDHGEGLSEKALAHAFERLWRADESRGRGGSGLGLAIVRAITVAHGGDVTAENVPGAGARFTVTLPCGPGSSGS